MGETPASRPRFHNLEQLIAGTTLVLGLAAAIPVGFFHNWMWAIGIVIGAFLSWLNLRWLKQGVATLAAASVAQANPEVPASSPQGVDTTTSSSKKATVPFGSYFFAMFRYALIALAVYVIFKYLKVPILSMIAGLFALGAATLVACLYEILRPVD
jgi:small-conductance mechanosensitive channel